MRTPEQNELRARYQASNDVLDEASARLTEALERYGRARDIARRHLEQGGDASAIETFLDPEPLRSSVSQAITELERARHETQRVLFRLLHAEGRTMTDIARTWGISRQLVSRLINEAEPQSTSVAATPGGP